MTFSDLALSKRLERAEGFACAQYAETRRRLFPESGAEWMECGGAIAAFDGVDSPVTQTFGLGIFEDLSGTTLDTIEAFFLDRGAPVLHEVSPFAGVAALELLCERGYRPVELSSVLYRPVAQPAAAAQSGVTVRIAGLEEADLWSRMSTRGWSHDHPEFAGILLQLGAVTAARVMVALPGSNSQRNAERKGFQIAYTRTKWQLRKPEALLPLV